MPSKEEQDVQQAMAQGAAITKAQRSLEKMTKPLLPLHLTNNKLLERMDSQKTIILMCGNPMVMEDIKHIADTNKMRFEKEEW